MQVPKGQIRMLLNSARCKNKNINQQPKTRVSTNPGGRPRLASVVFAGRYMVWLCDREGPILGHKRPACMLLFVFLRGGFSIHCHSANEEGVPFPSKPLMAQGQNNRRLAR